MNKLKLFFACLLMAVLSIGQLWATEAVLNSVSSKEVVTTSGGSVSKVFDGVTCLITRNSSNQPGFYTSSGIVRYYSGDIMTLSVASGSTITQIDFVMNSGNVGTASTGTLSSNTWTGEAESVSFTGSATVKITSITVTYSTGGGDSGEGGQGGDEPTLTSIAVETAPTKTTYTAGETFDPAGLVITRNYSNSTNDTYTYANHTSEFSFEPSTTTALETSNTSVTITYNGQSTTQSITVNAATPSGDGGISDLTFTAACGGSGTATDGAIWTITSDAASESTYDGTKGVHYGTGTSGSGEVTYIQLATDDISGTIEKVVVNASTASGVSATVSVTVGGVAFGGNPQSLSSSATDYTFTGSAAGGIVVLITKASKATKALYCKSVKVTHSAGSGSQQTAVCAAPTFSPAAGTYTSTQSVAISCTTPNSTIYYTTDGTDPTASSSVYSSAITVSETTTIKAIAAASDMTNSSVASAAYTILTPLTTMDAIYSAATTTNTDVAITFNNWVVSGVKGNKVYVTDGTKGFVINQANHGFAVNNVLSGTAICKLQLNYGNAQLSELTSITTGLSVATNGTVTPVEVSTDDIAALGGINTGSVITISGACTTNNNKYYINGVQLWNNLFNFTTPTQGNNYTCTGVYYYGGDTYGHEIMPRSADDLTGIVVVGAPETPTFSPAGGSYTQVQNVTINCETQGVTIYYTTDGTTTPTTESSVYATPISVGEDMTIMAIAVDENGTSSVATATYDINLPEDENVQKTFNLSIDQTTTATENAMTWVATNVTIAVAKGNASTATNNYYPGTTGKTYTSTRFYPGSNLTITPNNKQIISIVFLATSNLYASALKESTWTNATAVIDANNNQKVIVTAHCAGPITASIGGTCGFTEIKVQYGAIVTSQVTLASIPVMRIIFSWQPIRKTVKRRKLKMSWPLFRNVLN